MSAVDELLTRNSAYDATAEGLPSAPALQVAVVTCMDARIDVYRLLGLRPGESHVIRNAGGVVTDDVMRSLAISQRLLGTREVALVHHTRCGMLGFTDEEFAATLRDETGSEPPWRAMAFADLVEDVRRGIAAIRDSPYLVATDSVRGFIVDVDTGRLTEV